MVAERRELRRKLGLLSLAVFSELILLWWFLPTPLGVSLALVGLWAVDHYFIGWMNLAQVREHDAIRGADAEEKIAAILSRLTDCVVLHDVLADHGNVDHIVVRKDGAVFLLETKSRGGVITESSVTSCWKQTHWNLYWLRGFLKARFGVEPWIHAAVVFPNAEVRIRRPLHHVHMVNGAQLERWMSRAPGNPVVARKLWPEIERVKTELQHRN